LALLRRQSRNQQAGAFQHIAQYRYWPLLEMSGLFLLISVNRCKAEPGLKIGALAAFDPIANLTSDNESMPKTREEPLLDYFLV